MCYGSSFNVGCHYIKTMALIASGLAIVSWLVYYFTILSYPHGGEIDCKIQVALRRGLSSWQLILGLLPLQLLGGAGRLHAIGAKEVEQYCTTVPNSLH